MRIDKSNERNKSDRLPTWGNPEIERDVARAGLCILGRNLEVTVS